MANESPTLDADITKKWYHLCFDVKRSIRYHEKREAYFARMNSTATAVSLIFGSSTIAAMVKQYDLIAYVSGALVALTGLVNLVSKSSEMARKHEALRQKWCVMLADMHSATKSAAELSKFESKRFDIEQGEPPIRRLVDLICYEEQLLAEGFSPADPADRRLFSDIGRIKRWTAHFVDWDASVVPPLKPLPQVSPDTAVQKLVG